MFCAVYLLEEMGREVTIWYLLRLIDCLSYDGEEREVDRQPTRGLLWVVEWSEVLLIVEWSKFLWFVELKNLLEEACQNR